MNLKKLCYRGTISAIVLLKFYLISEMEIIPLPYDPAVYTTSANHLSNLFGIQLSGYPTWIWFCHQLGVPQRLAIEGLWTLTCYIIGSSIFPSLRIITRLLCFTALVFLPQTYYLFNTTFTEGFYICLTGVVISLLIKILSDIKSKKILPKSLGCGLLIGLMQITRNESIVINTYLAVLFISTFIFIYRFKAAKELAGTFALIYLISIIVPTAVKIYNYRINEVWMINVHQMPSHLKLLNNLASIDTHSDNPRFVPITIKARELAYQVSPSLALLKPEVESKENIFYKASSRANLNGEIGAGWIWLLFNSASPIHPITLKARDELYRSASREIHQAFKKHELDHKFSPHPLIGNCLKNVIKYYSLGLQNAWANLSYLYGSHKGIGDEFNKKIFELPKDQQQDQNIVCDIREAILSKNHFNYSISGWAVAIDKNHPITEIQTTGAGNVVYNVKNNYRRADIDTIFGKSVNSQIGMGFNQFESNQVNCSNVKIIFISKHEIVGEVLNPKPNNIYDINGKYGRVFIGVDNIAVNRSLKSRVMNKIISLYSSELFWVVMITFTGLSFVLVLLFDKTNDKKLFFIVFSSLFIWIFLNFGFYSLLGAVCWKPETRYLFNTSIYICTLFIYSLMYISNLTILGIRNKYYIDKLKVMCFNDRP
jgi:hypothetical protein